MGGLSGVTIKVAVKAGGFQEHRHQVKRTAMVRAMMTLSRSIIKSKDYT